MYCLLAQAESDGALFVPNTVVTKVQLTASNEIDVFTSSWPDLTDSSSIRCKYFVNSAGLYSSLLSQFCRWDSDLKPRSMHFAKGNYFKLSSNHKFFSHLVYPVPEPKLAGLGVHATIDMAGAVRFGPDVEWLKDSLSSDHCRDKSFIDCMRYLKRTFDYSVDGSRINVIKREIRKYFPSIDDCDLIEDYSGIRPKLSVSETSDFAVDVYESGNARLVELHGIESPGLTSCLSIADYVCSKLTS